MNFQSLITSCPSCNKKFGFKSYFKMKEGMIKCLSCEKEIHISGREIDENDLSYKILDHPPQGITETNNITSIEIKLGFWSRRTISSMVSGLIMLAVILFSFNKDGRLLQFDPNDYFTWIPLGIICFFIFLAATPFMVSKKIIIDKSKIEMDNFPRKLFFKNKEILVNDIEQLFTEKRKIKSGKRNRKQKTVFDVNAKMKNNEKEKLIAKGLVSPAHAYYIEKRIEDYLKIKDKKIDGEFDVRKDFSLTGGSRYEMMKDVLRK